MKPVDFPEKDHELKAPDGVSGVGKLPCFFGKHEGFQTIVSCWEGTPEEIEKIRKTGQVWLTVLGGVQPPVEISADPPFETKSKPGLRVFTVIGVHDKGRGGRYADTFEEASAKEAEDEALATWPGLLIAGVIEGEVEMVL